MVVDCPVTKKGENIFSSGDEKETEAEWRPGQGGGLGWGGGQGARSSMEALGPG